MSIKVFVVVLAALMLVACSASNADKSSVESQIKGNQGVILELLNSKDIEHVYFNYYGQRTDAPQIDPNNQPGTAIYDENGKFVRWEPKTTPTSLKSTDPRGQVQIAELNMLVHNVGGSATAGGLFVSGYDPRLLNVSARRGQVQINNAPRSLGCIDTAGDINVLSTGQYDVTFICRTSNESNTAVGVDASNGRTTVSLFNLAGWADKIASEIKGENVDFFSKYGLFTDSRVDCTNRDGRNSCSIRFGNPSYNPNRASHGYLLVNMFYGQLRNCGMGCRVFPPNAPTDILSGVEDLAYPGGESLYYDYDVYLNASAWNPLLNDMKQTMQVTACYFYTTTVTPTVCVDPDPTTTKNEPCSTTPITFKGTQGAPIRVSKIEQKSQQGGTAFTIYIEHVGNGDVWYPGAFEQCNPLNPNRPDRRMQDAVVLLDARISGDLQQLKCYGASMDDSDDPGKRRVVRLNNGKGQITCLYPVAEYNPSYTSRQAYQSALTLEFGYVYQNVVQKEIVIHRT